ncbi:MAG: GGDEF domain-containing protein, partial [Lachnospiraceae bacterium]|nr:GGDEF domain-containing protein [Lachnospiraceae bacterium]
TRYTSEKDSGVVEEIRANIRGRDEVTSLANEVVSMIIEIENHIKFLLITNQELAETKGDVAKMTDLARKDALTGIRNRTAYDKETEKLQHSLDEGDMDFGMAMIDLNFLKRTNDTYGHEKGNESIKKLCYIVCHVFEHSPVFRIGGDEFVAILKNEDFRNRDALLIEFDDELERLRELDDLEPWERISAAIGIAVYDSTCDRSVSDVFKRADSIMYECKKRMKATRQG